MTGVPSRENVGTAAVSSYPRRLPERRVALLLVTPTLVILFILSIYPLIWAGMMAFRVENLFNPAAGKWIGFRNFDFLLTKDQTFWKTMWLTGLWCTATVSIQLLLGYMLAVLLDSTMRGIGLLRTLIVIPVFISPVAMGLTWRFMYEPISGIINYLITSAGFARYTWHTMPESSLISLMITDIWQWTPFVTLILLAGMQGISTEVVEAARLDRVRGWTYTRRIVLPLIWPVVTVVVLLRLVDAIRVFDLAWVITRGGPGTSSLLASVNMYSQFQAGRLGIMAAYGFLLLIAINIVVVSFLRVLYRQEKETRRAAPAAA